MLRHQLAVSQYGLRAQRRFFQHSRPLLGDERPQPSISTSWGRLGVLGSGIPQPVPRWGLQLGGHLFGETQTQGRGGESSHSAAQLLPSEQRARELMMDGAIKERQQAIRTDMHTGPGPQSNRAGRPQPIARPARPSGPENSSFTITQGHRAKPAQNQTAFRRPAHPSDHGEGKVAMRSSQHNHSNQPHHFRRMNLDGPATTSDDHSLSTPISNWTQLRRRRPIEAGTSSAPPTSNSTFAQNRAHREEEAKSARYTPLISRNISPIRFTPNFDTKPAASDPAPSRFPREMPRTSNFISLDVATTNRAERPSSQKISSPQRYDELPFDTAAPLKDQSESLASFLPPTTNKKRENLLSDYLPASSVQSEVFKPTSKGKSREKARRREKFADTYDELDANAATERMKLKKQRKAKKVASKKVAKATPILLPEFISISNLAIALKVRLDDLMVKLEELGFEDTHHDYILNTENAGLITMEYGFEPIIDWGDSQDLKARGPAEDLSKCLPRAPVVTIMGHVDHGKTTLLDWLRKSSVAATEHGGITQHIGAFSVVMPSGKTITFLDTPGHAAFLSMRRRGANVTDIVILVVAADDSVMPQTIEAINHARAAKVPIIVAINKVDKKDADIERVKKDLSRNGIEIEDYGGDTQVVCVSGKTGHGMEELEEAAVTLSEILDTRAEKCGQAEGWVLEASIKPQGKVATVLVKRGTIRPGDCLVAGQTWTKIRCLRNEAGAEVAEAGPGEPVEVDGWRDQPLAGDEALQAQDEAKAKSVIQYRLEKEERDRMADDMEAINDSRKVEQEKRDKMKQVALLSESSEEASIVKDRPSGPQQVYFIVKGDVSGSVEAVVDQITTLGNKEVQPHILRSGVGQLSEFDIEHAATAKGHVITFNTVVDANISGLAKEMKVKIFDHNIIYRLVDDIKAELEGHLPKIITQRVTAEADVSQVFKINVKGRTQKPVAGCKIKNGTLTRNSKVRVLRGGKPIYEGTLSSLKNVQKDIMEARKGTECGLSFADFDDFQTGDQVQGYEEKEEKRYL